MWWIVLVGGVAGLLALVEMKKATTAGAITLPVTLPSTGSGGAGETAVQQETQSAESTATSVATDAATGNLTGAASAAITGLITQITQHSARLAAAKAENTAMQPAVAAFDADLQAIAAAYSSGSISAAQAAQALQTLDTNIYNNLHGLVGKPGTAWGNPPFSMTQRATAAQAECNTQCTVSCCVYSDDLHSPLSGAFVVLTGGPISSVSVFVQAVQGGFVLTVPEIYPPNNPAYGNFTRPSYQVAFVRSASVPTSVIASLI